MTIFYSSDTHFFHDNIIKYCNRPFWKKGLDEEGNEIDVPDSELMNETLIQNWNNKVKPTDTLYFLGDFGFASQQKIKSVLDRLNGNKYLCRGNHDKPLNNFHNYFNKVFDLQTVNIYDPNFKNGICHIAMCHYPMLSWDRQFHGSLHLHGHVHSIGNIKQYDDQNRLIRRYDVGVDANNFAPVSLDEILEFFKE